MTSSDISGVLVGARAFTDAQHAVCEPGYGPAVKVGIEQQASPQDYMVEIQACHHYLGYGLCRSQLCSTLLLGTFTLASRSPFSLTSWGRTKLSVCPS